MTRIRTWVVAATTQSTNHYTITATSLLAEKPFVTRISLWNTPYIYIGSSKSKFTIVYLWFYGVMVSTQDFESCDPSSNLGRTYIIF